MQELWEVEKLWDELLDVRRRLRGGEPPGGGHVAEGPIGDVETLSLEGQEHGREGRQSHKEMEDNATVGVVRAIVVGLGGMVWKAWGGRV